MIRSFFAHKHNRILFFAIIFYIIAFCAFSYYKYITFSYNVLDLAIFHQTVYNTAHGDFFALSIHPQSYLSDHFTPIILLFLPLYLLFQSPLTLLFLQTFVLAAATIPLYLISKKILPKHWALMVAMLYLFSPFTLNINLFDFHLLPFIPLFFFSAFYFFLQKRFWRFFISILLLLLVNEDVSLLVVSFGFVILLDLYLQSEIVEKHILQRKDFLQKAKENLRWWLVPIVLGILWFVMAMKIISIFAIEGNYKFLIYYSWLGHSLFEVGMSLLFHPLIVLRHFLKIGNIGMYLGMLMPFIFIPLLRPRYLLLALFSALSISLVPAGGSDIALHTHYIALFFPALFIAFIFSLERILNGKLLPGFLGVIQKEKTFLVILILVSFIYSSIFLGPSVFGTYALLKRAQKDFSSYERLVEKITPEESVISSYRYLPALSSRKELSSLNYLYLGTTQFSVTEFPVPANIDALLIDFDDILSFRLQYNKKNLYSKDFPGGADRLAHLLSQYQAEDVYDNLVLFRKNVAQPLLLFTPLEQEELPVDIIPTGAVFSNELRLVGYQDFGRTTNGDQHFVLYWQGLRHMQDDYYLKFVWEDGFRYVPLAYGAHETRKLGVNDFLEVHYYLDLPVVWNQAELQVVDIVAGGLEIGPMRDLVSVVDDEDVLGTARFQ